MSTENETWQGASAEETPSTGRDSNKPFNEGGYNRPYGNRDNYGNERPYRPRFTNGNAGSERPQRTYRPRFNPNEGNERPYRSYGNNESGERTQHFGNQQRSYRPRFTPNNNGGMEGNRVQHPYSGEARQRRPRFNPNSVANDERLQNYGDRPQRPYAGGEQRGGGFRPRYTANEGGFDRQRPYGNNGGDRPQRPRFNPNGGNRPSAGGYGRPQQPQQRRPQGNANPAAKFNNNKKKPVEYKELYVDPNEPIRLNKFLANAGICSRREADEFITAGVVSVNGVVVTELGTKIKRSDEVKFHDQPVTIERKIYVLLNKPKDTVTTSDDPQARRTVMDLVKGACTERIYPVGRLDRNTTGVLLLTNDGDLASKLTHPKYLKKKIYHVHLDKNLTMADMEKIAAGIQLEDGEVHADEISYTDEAKKNDVGIEIHSGKNRIVRRIFESLGYKVVKLDRVYFAGLTKKGLRRGDWRYLTEQEVNFLRMGSFE